MELSTEPKPVFLPRSSRFVVGLDLGQAVDPTAIAVLEKKIGVIDHGSDADRHCGLTAHLQKPASRIEVRHLERLPLGLTYLTIISHVAELMRRASKCSCVNTTTLTSVVATPISCNAWQSAGLQEGNPVSTSNVFPLSVKTYALHDRNFDLS